jgi:hypothetical protein
VVFAQPGKPVYSSSEEAEAFASQQAEEP